VDIQRCTVIKCLLEDDLERYQFLTKKHSNHATSRPATAEGERMDKYNVYRRCAFA